MVRFVKAISLYAPNPLPYNQVNLNRKMKICIIRITKIVGILLGIILLTPILQCALLSIVDPPFSAYMICIEIEDFFLGKPLGYKYTPLPMNQIPDVVYQSIVASEDQRFFTHNGFDFIELKKVLDGYQNDPTKRMRGASTITQQLCKNLFLPPMRNLLRKGLEAYYTFWLECFVSKNRILYLYANLVEFGKDVYGVEAGAQHHFNKSIQQLTHWQTALLIAILPNPREYNPTHPSRRVLNRARFIRKWIRPLP